MIRHSRRRCDGKTSFAVECNIVAAHFLHDGIKGKRVEKSFRPAALLRWGVNSGEPECSRVGGGKAPQDSEKALVRE
jgi:hypothetical protein